MHNKSVSVLKKGLFRDGSGRPCLTTDRSHHYNTIFRYGSHGIPRLAFVTEVRDFATNTYFSVFPSYLKCFENQKFLGMRASSQSFDDVR